MLLLLTLFPSVFLFCFIYKNDKVEKEPGKLLLKVFAAGIISIIPAVISELILDSIFKILMEPGTLLYIAVSNFIGVALVEEFFKRVLIKKACWNDPAFNYSFDAIVYCVCGSLGFATLENIMYVFGSNGGMSVAIMRALLSIPGHVFWGVYMGYYFGLAKRAQLRGELSVYRNYWALSLIVPFVLHGFYDFCLTSGYSLLISMVVILCIIVDIMAIRRVKHESAEDSILS